MEFREIKNNVKEYFRYPFLTVFRNIDLGDIKYEIIDGIEVMSKIYPVSSVDILTNKLINLALVNDIEKEDLIEIIKNYLNGYFGHYKKYYSKESDTKIRFLYDNDFSKISLSIEDIYDNVFEVSDKGIHKLIDDLNGMILNNKDDLGKYFKSLNVDELTNYLDLFFGRTMVNLFHNIDYIFYGGIEKGIVSISELILKDK